METLPTIKKQETLMVYAPNIPYIDKRKLMLEIPEVAKALSPIEKYIFKASTKQMIRDTPDADLLPKVANLFKFIARDVGIKQELDQYEYTRIYDILQKYYGNFSLAEIKLAFELSLTGELDKYLPRGRDGEADKNHYQQFSIEYLTKIMNAYQKSRNETLFKADRALPPPPPRELTPEEKRESHNKHNDEIYYYFLEYKYTGKFRNRDWFDGIRRMFCYNFLKENGLLINVSISEQDTQKALQNVMRKISTGIFNQFTAQCIRIHKENHSDVQSEALNVAHDRAVKETFDLLIKYEVQLTDYLTWL